MKRNKGISLIVLIITIIVIIILAGSVILNLTNSNIIPQANEAKFKTNIEQYNSELAIVISGKYLQSSSFNPRLFNAAAWDGTQGNIAGTIKEYIKSITVADGAKLEIQKGELVYVGDVLVEKDYIKEMGILNKIELGINVIATENATVNGKVATYQNPLIPKGFKAINDGATWPTDWNKGLVIEDVNGNQFVWVPVDGTNVTYTKWCTTNISYASTTDDTLPVGVTNEKNQVLKYGGFYIARYEAGKVGVDQLVSKKNAIVWANIKYTDLKVKSESMYNTDKVKSGLVTGTQWDTIMKWVQNLGKNITDSRSWGNFYDSIAPANVTGYKTKQVAGYSEMWKANNIYDLAGNTWDWTSEIYGATRVCRGGVHYASGGGYAPAAYRGNDYPSVTNASVCLSFRVVLYII